jgi:hypothetical protein
VADGIAVGPDGNLWFAEDLANKIGYIAPGLYPPEITSLPSIFGNAETGETLLASPGSWTNEPIGYSYQWEECDSPGEFCSPIAGANAPSYVLTARDVGHTIRVQVSATNAAGASEPVNSAPTVTVLGSPPVNIGAPSISGAAEQGKTLVASSGLWTNEPISYAYQWEECNSLGESCSPISGAEAPSYVLTEGDVGHTVRVQVTAANEAGEGEPVSSEVTSVVVGSPQITILNSRATVARRMVSLDLACTGGRTGASCRGMVRLSVEVRGRVKSQLPKTVSLGRSSYSIPSKTTQPVALHLTRRAVPLLNRFHEVRIHAIATASDGGDTARTILLQR